MNKLIGMLFVALLFLIPTQTVFAEIEKSSPLLCSVINAAEYTLEDGCVVGTAETFDLPQFIKIDFQKSTISEVGENTKNRISRIINFKHIDDKFFMQGVENGRNWGIIIQEKTGKMSATVSDEQVGFVVFGVCTDYRSSFEENIGK